MSELSRKNKFLIVPASVVLTDRTDIAIAAVDIYFERANKKATVSRALSTPEDQLRIIRNYLKRQGLDSLYPEAMNCHIRDMKGSEYVWQMAWSNLLNKGVIINPAMDAICLMDTTYDDRSRKGKLIHQTPHVLGGAFDIGGGENGVADEAAIIQQALNDRLPELRGMVVERINNCVHVDCR